MKKKILFIILCGIIITFWIYTQNKKEDIYFVSLGDGIATGMTAYDVEGYNFNDYLRDELDKQHRLENYISTFSSTNQTTEDLIFAIENNYVDKESGLSIQQALNKAKIITLALGMDEIENFPNQSKNMHKRMEQYKKNMEKIIRLIRNFNHYQIFIIGLYDYHNEKSDSIDQINEELQNLSNKYQITFIDISDFSLKKEYYLSNNSYYFNYKAHQEIANRIKNVMKKSQEE